MQRLKIRDAVLLLLVITQQSIYVCFYSFPLIQSQLSPVSKGAYREYLGKLELQYGKLLVSTPLLQFTFEARLLSHMN